RRRDIAEISFFDVENPQRCVHDARWFSYFLAATRLVTSSTRVGQDPVDSFSSERRAGYEVVTSVSYLGCGATPHRRDMVYSALVQYRCNYLVYCSVQVTRACLLRVVT